MVILKENDLCEAVCGHTLVVFVLVVVYLHVKLHNFRARRSVAFGTLSIRCLWIKYLFRCRSVAAVIAVAKQDSHIKRLDVLSQNIVLAQISSCVIFAALAECGFDE